MWGNIISFSCHLMSIYYISHFTQFLICITSNSHKDPGGKCIIKSMIDWGKIPAIATSPTFMSLGSPFLHLLWAWSHVLLWPMGQKQIWASQDSKSACTVGLALSWYHHSPSGWAQASLPGSKWYMTQLFLSPLLTIRQLSDIWMRPVDLNGWVNPTDTHEAEIVPAECSSNY